MDKKALNLPILTSLVVGNMIGTGIYVLPASLAEYGSAAFLAWFYTSIGAMLLALTFSYLNKRFPQTGGPYVYCREAYGTMTGFIMAYVYWISYLVATAGVAVSSIGYLGFIFPSLDANTSAYHPYIALLCELAIVWLFTWINIIGIHAAGVMQIILTVIKVIPLIVITLIGFTHIDLNNFTSLATTSGHQLSAIGSAAALTFWAFIGLESATVPAENTEGPRDIYKATIYGTLLTSIIYIACTFVLMGMLPSSQLQQSQFPFAEAGTLLFGNGAAFIITICAVISGLGTLNACILVEGQVLFAAARDRLFPHQFAKLSKKDAPVASQLLSSTIVSFFLVFTVEPTLLKQFNNIALLAGLLTFIVYLACTLAELKFIIKNKLSINRLIWHRSTWITILASIYSGWMISNFDIDMLLLGMIILILSIPIYFLSMRHNKKYE